MPAFFLALFFILEMLFDSIRRRTRALHGRTRRRAAPADKRSATRTVLIP